MASYIHLVVVDLIDLLVGGRQRVRDALGAALAPGEAPRSTPTSPSPGLVDADGSLTETLAAGLAPDLDAWADAPTAATLQHLLHRQGASVADASCERVLSDAVRHLLAGFRANPPEAVPGLASAIRDLRAQGVRVAVASSFSGPVTELLLDTLGWVARPGAGPVDAVVCLDMVPAGPPAPHLIHAAMALTGVQDVHRVLAAGDTAADMQAARNSGGLAIGVLTGAADADQLARTGADDVLDSVADLPLWIARARVRPPVPAA